MQVFLVFGKSGWIGGLIGQLLKERGLKFEYANARLEDRAEVIADIERVRYSRIHALAKYTMQRLLYCSPHKPVNFNSLLQVKPTHILNAAGLTGRPNVDWCEDHKVRHSCCMLPLTALTKLS